MLCSSDSQFVVSYVRDDLCAHRYPGELDGAPAGARVRHRQTGPHGVAPEARPRALSLPPLLFPL